MNRSDIVQDVLKYIAAQLKADLISSKKSDGKNELTKFCDNLMNLSVGVNVMQQHQQRASGGGVGSVEDRRESALSFAVVW